ncbi:DUF397 domain-containing protein [Streptomyces sp. ISL-10]|nr:DUF397 domain-containing protein [Streptomyces sp. ISL-10]
MEGAVPQLDTVQLDTALGANFVDAPTPLANYRSRLDMMEESALPPMIPRSSSGPSQASCETTAGNGPLDWRRSSYCGGGGNNCVEVAVSDGDIAVRDSVFPHRTFAVDRRAFAAFVAGARLSGHPVPSPAPDATAQPGRRGLSGDSGGAARPGAGPPGVHGAL